MDKLDICDELVCFICKCKRSDNPNHALCMVCNLAQVVARSHNSNACTICHVNSPEDDSHRFTEEDKKRVYFVATFLRQDPNLERAWNEYVGKRKTDLVKYAHDFGLDGTAICACCRVAIEKYKDFLDEHDDTNRDHPIALNYDSVYYVAPSGTFVEMFQTVRVMREKCYT